MAACSVPGGWDGMVGKPTHFVIFGEVHGTVESPTLFGETACALAERGERLLVAVELGDNDGLQRAWSVSPVRFPTALRAEMPEWATRDDGVASQAMFTMLVRLHTLKASGHAIDVVAFNGTEALEKTRFADLPGQGPHEAGQAENIRAVDARQLYTRVLVLVGNYHARKRPIAPGGVSYQPMAMRLADPGNIVSLHLVQSGGSSWGCQLKGAPPLGSTVLTSDMIQCSAHQLHADGDWRGPPRIVRAREASGSDPKGAYDAELFIGAAKASAPVGLRP